MLRKFVVGSALVAAAAVGLNTFNSLPGSAALADHHEAKKDLIAVATGEGMTEVSTLVAAIKAAELVTPLQGEGPFTVFAPTNDAFENLPDGTVEMLLKPENKDALTKVLTYHVVPGRWTFDALVEEINKGNGKAQLKTASGGTLTVWMNGPHNILIKDEKGDIADISTYDVIQSNGVIQVIDTVLLPN